MKRIVLLLALAALPLAAGAQVLGFGSAPQGSIGYNMSSAIARVMAENGIQSRVQPYSGSSAVLPLEQVIRNLQEAGIPIIEGPVARTGAKGSMRSVYVRDPDLNLVEVSVYET